MSQQLDIHEIYCSYATNSQHNKNSQNQFEANPKMPLSRSEKILLLSKAITSTFSSSEWTEIGYLTATDEYIDNYPRLLRSLQWGDEDYKGHAFNAIAYILDANPANLRILIDYEPIAHWSEQHQQAEFELLKSEVYGLEIPETTPLTSSETILEALADAQALLRTRGPMSAVDRVHTALHAYLKVACEQIGLDFPKDATANQLLRLLIENHPALHDLGPRTEDIRRILRTSATIVDAMGTIRNQASLAHPNEDLLDNEEALFVINIARSLFRFLDAKLPPKR
jgi:AbiJ N-terminal domain 5/Abortive infection C-terminus